MDDVMLERLLVRAAAATVYPPTPAVRGRVTAAILAPTATSARRSWRPAFVLAGLAIVALAVAITLAVPSSRSAVADLFRIEGTKIERLPTPAAGVTPTPLPPASDPASIATPVSLSEAQRRIGFRPALPRGAGDPSAVYVKTYGETDSVAILRYAAYDLWEMRPRDLTFGKGAPQDVIIRETAVGGRPAYWIEGGPHVVAVFDQRGEIPGSERTVAHDTLIWRTDFALYRLELALSQAEALSVAETLP